MKNLQLNHGKYVIIIIISLCIGIYSQSLSYDFINLDDYSYVALNYHTIQGLTKSSIHWALTTFSAPYYMPLTRISYLVDSSIYGINPFGFHLTNLILHILNSLLVFYFTLFCTRKLVESSLIAIIFAIHPLHVEAVVWIAQRKELLAALFGLISLISYVRHISQRPTSLSNQEYQSKYYLLSLFFYLISLLAKPAWITLPFILLLIDWLPYSRFQTESAMKLIIEKLPFFLLLIFFTALILSHSITDAGYLFHSSKDLPIFQRVLNAPVIYLSYIFKTFIPINLSGHIPYPHTPFSLWKIFSSCAFLVLITVLFVNKSYSSRFLLFGWLWFLGALFPFVGLFSMGESIYTGDRWTYLPHIGLFISIVLGTSSLISLTAVMKPYIKIIVFLAVLLMFVISWHQVQFWKNSETFWLRVIELAEDNDFAHNSLGSYYHDIGNFDKAIYYTKKAHKINPTEQYYKFNLANIYFSQGDYKTAWDIYYSIIRSGHSDMRLLSMLSDLSINNRQYAYALTSLKGIIETPLVKSSQAGYVLQAHLLIGHILLVTGNTEEAEKQFRVFLDVSPKLKKYRCDFGIDKLGQLAPHADPVNSISMLTKLCDQSLHN